jgi:type II secretory pathway component PulF
MALYQYEFIENKKRYSDVLACDTITHARALLTDKGIFFEKITPVTSLLKTNSLKQSELLDFFSDAASYLSSGITLANALDMIAEDEKNLTFRTAVLGIADQIRSGCTLQKAAEEFSIFPREAMIFIITGEKSNNLVQAFKEAADYYSMRIERKRTLLSAVTYPAFVFVVMTAALFFISFKVLPFLETFFNKSGMELPMITRGVIFLSKILTKGWPALMIISLAVPYISKAAIWKNMFSAVIRRSAWLNALYSEFKSADLIRMLSAFISSGMTIRQALSEAGSMEDNREYKDKLRCVMSDIDEGMSFRKSVEQRKMFTKRSTRILKAGEISGNLEKSMKRAASILENQNRARIDNIMNLIEPALILFLSGCAGMIIVSVIVPLMNIKSTGL